MARALIKSESILLDDALQPRTGIDEAHWRGMAEWLVENPGETLPPVETVKADRVHVVWDGFHRVLAYREAGRALIPVNVREGTTRDALLLSFGANEFHGLKRSNEDKARAVRSMLSDEEWAEWSDREVAKACNVSHVTVSRIRKELEAASGKSSRSKVKVKRAGQVHEMKVPAKKAAETDREETHTVKLKCEECGFDWSFEPGHDTTDLRCWKCKNKPTPVADPAPAAGDEDQAPGKLPEPPTTAAERPDGSDARQQKIERTRVNFRALIREMPADMYQRVMKQLDQVKEVVFE